MLKKNRLNLTVLCVTLSILASVPASAQNASATRYYNQGIDAYTQGQTDQALAYFRQATQSDQSYSDAWYNMGSLYFQKDMYAQSEDAFRKAVQYNPSDVLAKFNLALALERQNKLGEAIGYLVQIPSSNSKYQAAQDKIRAFQARLAQQPAPANSADTDRLRQLARQGSAQPQGSHSPAPPGAKLEVQTFSKGYHGPTGITIGPGGYLYVANYSKNMIYKVGANGEKEVFVKSGGLLQGPMGLTYNPKTDEMYAANYLNNTIVRISRDGRVSVLASGLKKPYNLYLDEMNNTLYVSEQETSSISRVQL